MYFIDDNFVDRKRGGLKEGGIVRNTAWIQYLKEFRPDTKFAEFKITHRIFKHLNFPLFLSKALWVRNDTFFFLYPKVGLPILNRGFGGRLFRWLFLRAMKLLIRNRNTLVFDISDIKYEQAVDLCLDNLDMEAIKDFEEKLFALGQKFIFASHAMRDYAVAKHGIPWENTDVCINGGYITDVPPALDIPLPENGLRFVYAGTLNKGRMVEQMIDSFPECNDRYLILLGISGEWIPAYLEEHNRMNVLYLGAHEESVARKIVASCDVGMIPYDDSRKYYNIAYPTKLSFYITAGIPYLATPVAEVNRVQQEHALGFTAPISDWNHRILHLDKDAVDLKKKNTKEHRHLYAWGHIFASNSFV